MMDKPLMRVLKHTYKDWQGYMKRMAAEVGIPDSYRMILIHLRRRPGANQRELAEYCDITPASVNQTVKEMVLTGYLEKEMDDGDQRLSHLYLTEKGKACAEKLREKIRQADQHISRLISREKEEEIITIMEMLSEKFREEQTKC